RAGAPVASRAGVDLVARHRGKRLRTVGAFRSGRGSGLERAGRWAGRPGRRLGHPEDDGVGEAGPAEVVAADQHEVFGVAELGVVGEGGPEAEVVPAPA